MTDYTDSEKQQLRSAAMGAVFLVSKAEPGMMDMIKESMAASKSFAQASGDLQGVFRGMSMPKIPKGSSAEIEAGVLSQLTSSVATIQAKAPQDVDPYRRIVLDACNNAAQAAKGVSAPESEMLSKVMQALGAGSPGTSSPTTGSPGASSPGTASPGTGSRGAGRARPAAGS